MTAGLRLPADAAHGFGGQWIDRSRPLQFRLNGRVVSGFSGDNVLSAALGDGIWFAGLCKGEPIGLDPQLPLFVYPAGTDPAGALPIDRLPALDRAELLTVGPRIDPMPLQGLAGRARLRLVGEDRALNLRLDIPAAPLPWRDQPPVETIEGDLIVIGAGVAGLAAAGTAVGLGKKVLLVERERQSGGALSYFGAIDGEEAPLNQITRLDKDLTGKGEVVWLTGAEAFRLSPGRVLVHQITSRDGRAEGRVKLLVAPRIVLASGTEERLPVFGGNRQPGIVGSIDAFQLAERYGVAPGRRLVVTTSHAHAYRYALYGKDAGLDIVRITDTRLDPRSRYVDFCKATGVTLSAGLVPLEAVPQRKTAALRLSFAGAHAGVMSQTGDLEIDGLVAAGGFEPRLALWIAAGGSIAWDPAARQFRPRGTLDGIVVAGSAAGWASTRAAIASGKAATLTLFGKPASPVDDPVLPVLFESPDAPTAIAPARPALRSPAFLERGTGFALRPQEMGRDPLDEPLARPVDMGLGAISASIDLGLVDAADGAELARERVSPGLAPLAASTEPPAPPLPAGAPPDPLPAYLFGRFGPRPFVCRIGSPEARRFEVGQLLFSAADASDPAQALGVVVAAPGLTEHGGWALVSTPPDEPQALVFVRDGGTSNAARVLSRQPARFS